MGTVRRSSIHSSRRAATARISWLERAMAATVEVPLRDGGDSGNACNGSNGGDRLPTMTMPGRPRLTLTAASLALLLALTACSKPSGLGSGQAAATTVAGTTAVPTSAFTPDPDPKYAAAVTAVAPLSAGRNVSCEGAVGPAALLAMNGDASSGPSPTATTLRNFLVTDPWHGMDGVDRTAKNTNWLLLEANAQRYVFAQRKGPVGVAAVIVFAKNADGKFVPDHNGSCQLQLNPTSDHKASISSVAISGKTATIHWLNGACGLDAPADEVLVRVEQAWTSTGTHLLVVTRPNPAIATTAAPTRAGATQTRWCGGVGIDSTAKLTLTTTPAGGRLYDDAGIPAQLVGAN